SDNEHIKYTLIPNFKDKIKSRHNENYDTTYSINSLGLRGSEPKRKKDAINIVVVGDSISFGLGLEGDYVYPVVLEKKLNSWAEQNNLSLDFEVYNCSVPGYNSEQEYFFCKNLVEATKPTIVIWQVYYNDIYPPMQYAMGNLIYNFEQKFPSHLLFLLNSYLYRNKIHNKIGPEGVYTSLKSMAEITSNIDAKFVTFIAPAAFELKNLDKLKKDSVGFVKLLKRAPSEYIDIISAFNGFSKEDIQVRPKDGHWNRIGHELVADKLAKRVIRHMKRKRNTYESK
ncbi:MAG: SGNH/GDSL hydrolase family protein, partial [Thermodesulfobacteriota bacterium]